MFGNGIFHSKLIYMINIWGNCSKEILNSLQIIQNRAARIIARNSWDISNRENFQNIGWLSVLQLVQYHSILQLHQVKLQKNPHHLSAMFDWNYRYQTRQSSLDLIKPIGTPRMELCQKSFRWQAHQYYNNIPREITEITDMSYFKKRAKDWIQKNVPFR